MAKIKYQRKKYFDATELEAMQKLYGSNLTLGDYKKYLLASIIFTSGFATLLFHRIIITIITGIFGAIYGFKVIMKQSITRNYKMDSLYERQKFINSLAQILTDDQKITLGAIELANSRIKGELHDDINILQARIEGANRTQVRYAFDELGQKYESDILFCQFIEQIETALTVGRANDIETIKQQKTYHNDAVRNTEAFLKVKEGHYAGIKLITTIIGALIILVMFSFGIKTYHEAFTRMLVGNIFGGMFYVILLYLMHNFYKIYFDDDILSIGKYVKAKANDENETNHEKSEVKLIGMAWKMRKLLLVLLGATNHQKLVEMNNTQALILNWTFKKMAVLATLVLTTLITFVVLELAGILLIGLAIVIFYYLMSMNSIKTMYMQDLFERQLKFAKFARLIIPYLKSKGSANLHTTFEKVLYRLEDTTDKHQLMKLMEEMTNNPHDLKPFTEYAKQMSKTDKAILFMNTIYDIKQGSADLSVIEEMDELMSQDLMSAIDDIIKFKENKFSLFSTKLTMSIIIFFLGVVISFLIYEVQNGGLMEVLG